MSLMLLPGKMRDPTVDPGSRAPRARKARVAGWRKRKLRSDVSRCAGAWLGAQRAYPARRFPAPQLFKVIVIADRRLHDMDHEVTEIHQYPFAGLLALDPEHAAAGLLHLVGDVACQRLGLPRRVGARHDDVVKQ